MEGNKKRCHVCVLQLDLEEQVWVDEQEMLPFSLLLRHSAVGAVKKQQHEWVCPLGLLNYSSCASVCM